MVNLAKICQSPVCRSLVPNASCYVIGVSFGENLSHDEVSTVTLFTQIAMVQFQRAFWLSEEHSIQLPALPETISKPWLASDVQSASHRYEARWE